MGREIGEVFRPRDQGGYRGDTGGWRTLAHQSADAWEEQYHSDPNSLRPSERQAYERDPSTLHRTILNADSPFRDYRESWIGATRAGQIVPTSAEFSEELRPFGGAPRSFEPDSGISQVTDRGGVPREMTPQQSGPPGSPRVEPGSGISQTTDRGGVPREMTPQGSGPPGSSRIEPGSGARPLAEVSNDPGLMTTPEPEQVVPYADETLPPDENVIPDAESPAVVILATPDLSPVEEEAPPDEQQSYDSYPDTGPARIDEEEVSYYNNSDDDDDNEDVAYDQGDYGDQGDTVAYDQEYSDDGEYY